MSFLKRRTKVLHVGYEHRVTEVLTCHILEILCLEIHNKTVRGGPWQINLFADSAFHVWGTTEEYNYHSLLEIKNFMQKNQSSSGCT